MKRVFAFLFFISFFAFPFLSSAQNKFGVKDETYAQYLSLIENNINYKTLHTADSLCRIADENNDYSAKCLFLSVAVRYQNENGEYVDLKQICDSLRETAKKIDGRSTPWRFWAYHTEVMYLINHLQLFAALDLATQLRKEAESDNDPYSMYIVLKTIADIYRQRNDMGLAGENYERALDYQQKYVPEADPSEIYIYLSSYYRRKSGRTIKDLERAKTLIEKGLETTSDPSMRARLMAQKAMSAYGERDNKTFQYAFSQCQKLFESEANNPEYLQVLYRKHILDHNYDSAASVAQRLPNQYERTIAQYVIDRAQGKYYDALINYERASHELNLIREQERRGDLADISANIGKYQLELSQHQLEQQKAQAQRDRAHMAIYAFALLCVIIIGILIVMVLFTRKVKQTNSILEEKNAELTEARNKALESENLKMLFLQNMSHEIRTPLNAIVGFSNLLASDSGNFTPEKREKFRSLINYNNELLTTLIDDVLTISDLESGKYIFEYRYTPINEVCQMSIESVKSRLKPGVRIEFKTQFEDTSTICTDGKRLWQVINNLLVNACKYTEFGVIKLEARVTDEHYLQLSVSDNGPGIDESKRYYIFERFTKLNSYVQGTGLGLNICKMVADRLNGRIYLDVDYHPGARFVFEIPMEQEMQLEPALV